MVGSPTIVLHEGQIEEDRMRREHLSHEQLMLALRQHGLDSIDQVKLAVLEVDGSLSVVPRKEAAGSP
ncbi:MAG: hypothetical protein NVS4B8_18230 [Herpetosiphon sp.]